MKFHLPWKREWEKKEYTLIYDGNGGRQNWFAFRTDEESGAENGGLVLQNKRRSRKARQTE